MLNAASHGISNTLKTMSSLSSHWRGGLCSSQEEGGCSAGFPFGSHSKVFHISAAKRLGHFHFLLYVVILYTLRQMVKLHDMVPSLLP
jgi:hypothetical protein